MAASDNDPWRLSHSIHMNNPNTQTNIRRCTAIVRYHNPLTVLRQIEAALLLLQREGRSTAHEAGDGGSAFPRPKALTTHRSGSRDWLLQHADSFLQEVRILISKYSSPTAQNEVCNNSQRQSPRNSKRYLNSLGNKDSNDENDETTTHKNANDADSHGYEVADESTNNGSEARAMIDEEDTEIEFSEGDDNSKDYLGNAPVVIMDGHNSPQAHTVVVDTGACSSFMRSDVVSTLELRKRPIPKHLQLEFVTPLGQTRKPTEFVRAKIKSRRISLDDFVEGDFRVLKIDGDYGGPDLWLGRPFIQKHRLLEKILAIPQFDVAGNPFHGLRAKRSSGKNLQITLSGQRPNVEMAAQVEADRAKKEEDGKIAESLERKKYASSEQKVTTDNSSTTGSWDDVTEWGSQGGSADTSWPPVSDSKSYYEKSDKK
jgi:hypothetical protein